jgi:hypothetical protein
MQYIVIDNGNKYYFKDKKMTKLHREDGPAAERANGSKFWYCNGEHHREDGPAIELSNGYKEWYINGKQYSEAEFNAKMESCDGKEVVIDGKTYTLTLKD